MNKFKFHNVGQGLFYTGSLSRGEYNFVFDCGTSNKKVYLNNAIQKYSDMLPFTDGRKYVDFIVISHLHKDHFSGLYDLLHKVDVGTLYLPYLGNNETFIVFALAHAIFVNSDDAEKDDNNLFDFMVNLYLNYGYRKDHGIENIVFYGENYSSIECDAHKNVIGVSYGEHWEFALYYSTVLNSILGNQLIKRIEIELEKFDPNYSGRLNETMISFVKSSKDVLTAVANNYKEVFGNETDYRSHGELNITSAILVHKPTNRRLCAYYSNKNNKLQSDRTTTVLTGDAFADDGYSKFWNDISDKEIFLWQIPHHGARENWQILEEKAIYNREIDLFVIPFGLGNSHKHPHTHTIDTLVDNNREFYNVTQLEPFVYTID